MNNCLFCNIADKKIKSNIIEETDKSFAFMDNNPISNGHILVIPKKHYRNLSLTKDEDLVDLILLAKKIAVLINNSSLENWGINYLSNEGDIAGQEIMHFHLHIIPKYYKNEGIKFSCNNKNISDIDKIKKILNN